MAPALYVFMLDFLKTAKEVKENYWALLIEPEWISSAIWQITNGKVEIVCTSPATRWESDLIEPIDASLSFCTQNLPDDYLDPTKTVFGVPNAWVEEGNIKEEYLEKLKKICTDLSLTPSGFVVLSEAISHFIKQEEDIALSGIVVGVSNEALDLSIFDAGKLIGTTSVLRSVSVEDDIVEGISRLASKLEDLPPRIILFNQKEQELEELKNSLNNADWNNLKFIHVPKIEILDPNKKIFAVALAGGSEISEVNGIVESKHQIKVVAEEMPAEEINKFASYEVNNIEEPNGITAEDLGFSVSPAVSTTVQETITSPKFMFNKPNIKFSKFKLPKFKFSFGNKSLIMGGSIVITLLFVCFGLWWFLPKATVTIFVSPKKLDENIQLSMQTDIKGQEINVSVNGEKTKSTTGTKTVGEKAKGSVKIQNGTGGLINLKSGTVLISSSDLKFVTTKSASISAALSTTEPGFYNVDVEAGSIGSEFNLSKDEKFKVSNYPKADVEAISIDTFSGGSSRQISAVSEDDRKKLLKELKEQLLEEAKEKLSEKLTEEMLLIETSIKEDTVEEDFSNKVGDEAINLKLNLTLKITGTAVSKNELSMISKKSLNDKVPAGFVLKDDQITYSFSLSDIADQFDVKISANLLPSIDVIEVAKKIAGRYPNIAEKYLETIAGFVNAEIRMIPTLKGKLGTLPHISKNIEIIITAEK